jgi:nucleoside-diphosphate-sugar epimerase
MNILLTGGTGFIGQRLLQYLTILEHSVHILSRGHVKNYRTTYCDFVKDTIPEELFSSNSIDTVFHLAGFAHDMRDASKFADLYYKVNVSATVQLAELAAKAGVKRFVFVSSVKAGGIVTFKKCMNENDQSDLEGVYGETKREAELRLLEIGKESGMHVSIIRPSLVYGPNVKGNLQLMLSGIKKGWFPPLPETNNKRSMIHVDDLVRAILLVADDDRANGEIFIATDGTPYSSRDIYNAMYSAIDKSIPKWSVPKILFDIASLASPRIKYNLNKLLGDECYSSAKLEALGFKAKKSLKDMNETDF